MDVNTMIQLINGVGFPIAACIALGSFIVWDKKERRKEREQQSEKTDDILKQLKESVDNNTKMVESMMKKLGG